MSTELEAVVNIAEGRDPAKLASLDAACGGALLDRHSDPWHHRSVFTLGGSEVIDAAESLARVAIDLIDIREHAGVHPRLGVVDVVPFAPIGDDQGEGITDLSRAVAARDAFIARVAVPLALPCFAYGPERDLPEVRRHAFRSLAPTAGPPAAHPTAGACCVGARSVLVAYNVVLADADLGLAKTIARALRSDAVRALGLAVGDVVQVSCNLIRPWEFGPAALVDAIARRATVGRTELVGLIPRSVLESTPSRRWDELDLSPERTIEARAAK